ncbi:hypothetical protein FAZ78_22430, partial [Cereibacter changlensis]
MAQDAGRRHRHRGRRRHVEHRGAGPLSPTFPEATAAGEIPRRLVFRNAGFLRQPRLRRILALAGHELRLGL